MELHLVADTNLFFECKPLSQLPWDEFDYEVVVILLTKPVLDEIDKHKNATSRTRARALEIFGHIRAMIERNEAEAVIRSDTPRVLLRRMTRTRPDPDFENELDYGKADERLVGITSMLAKNASGADIKLFTNDGGAAMTAADFNVPHLLIRQEWRRPSAKTDQDKKIKDLEKDLAAYRYLEPRIAIKSFGVLDSNGSVKITRKVAVPLSPDQIEDLIASLTTMHPKVVDFTAPAPSMSEDSAGPTMIEFITPSDEKIAEYSETKYPGWLMRCRKVFEELHKGRGEVEPEVMLACAISNDGTCPAHKVRIEFEAKGEIELRRLDDEADDDDAGERETNESSSAAQATAVLPRPPKPPQFERRLTRPTPQITKPKLNASGLESIGAGAHLSNLERLSRTPALSATDKLTRDMARFSDPAGLRALMKGGALSPIRGLDAAYGLPVSDRYRMAPSEAMLRSYIPPNLGRTTSSRDPEGFYYAWPAGEPVKKGAFTCDLWRHCRDDEIFEFMVTFPEHGPARGVVECVVHADNLTQPAIARLKVELVVKKVDLLAVARALVEACA
ncbi:PIN domain-containing protein [Neorhizobium sp. BT27B]|uniref:hypothetical protein n=1 Tax=Neorhizobium sp. BT27B TaxID=3142625 RepID=UPI003D2E9CB4